VRQRDRESLTDSDPHDLFFGPAEDDLLLDYEPVEETRRPSPNSQPRHSRSQSRADTLRVSRTRRRRRFMGILALLLVAVVAVSGYFIALPIYHYLHPSDYDGSGSGNVIVTIRANDGAEQIGQTLHNEGVVASDRAFTDAASANSKSQNIQPGTYRLHKHMSASKALSLLLDPTSRVNSDVVVTEGATIVDVEKRLTAPPCTAKSAANTVCGLGEDKAAVTKALINVKALGLPTDYMVDGKTPVAVEGFLFPATYPFDDKTNVTDALQQMVGKFTDQARATHFTAQAKALNITPYEELIIASIAQAEAKFPADYAKVARVILNRLVIKKNLQIDATSAYAAKLKGIDPLKIPYASTPGPYNTYNHAGLPPTPISNPGAEAMGGAAHPAAGNWLYYVNGDKEGHLFFTHSEAEFTTAANKCKANHWGCG
jgi:UPF0755 protein